MGLVRSFRDKEGHLRVESLVAIIGIVCLVSIATMVYSMSLFWVMIHRQEPLIRTSENLKLEIGLAHLWLEEALAGDNSIDLQADVYAHIDDALSRCRAMGNGGSGSEAPKLPGHPNTWNLDPLCDRIQHWRGLTESRWADRSNERAGTSKDQEYDAVFRRILRLATAHQRNVNEVIRKDRDLGFRIHGGLSVLLLALFVWMSAAVARNYRNVSKLKEELAERVTERTAELSNSLARYKAITDTAFVGIISIDESGIMQSVNPAIKCIFGYEAGELVGRSVNLLISPDQRQAHDAALARYVTTGVANILNKSREVEGRRKDGSLFPMDLAVSEVSLDNQRLFVGLIRDITRRKQAEEKARRREEELARVARVTTMGEMATAIAHEINQPLAAIVNYSSGCVRRLRSGKAADGQILEAMEQVAIQGERAGKILRRIRNFVTPGSAPRATVSVNEVVHDVVEFAHPEIRDRKIALRMELAPGLPPILADRVQMEQVLLNLLLNGIEALEGISGRREVAIRTAVAEKGGIQVEVSDTGMGFGAEDGERLFEPFYSTKANGMGMGLAISRTLIEAHGGELSAAANTQGGATLRFVLPAAEEPPHEP